jgi:DDE family transposase
MAALDKDIKEKIIKDICDFANIFHNILKLNNDACINRNNLKIRSKKTNLFDACAFRLLYTKGTGKWTHENSKSAINDFRGQKIYMRSYARREENLDVTYFKELVEKLVDYRYKNITDEELIVAVDGMKFHGLLSLSAYGHTENQSRTCVSPLISGVYDSTYGFPISMDLVNHANEREAFIQFLKRKTEVAKKCIFVFDRGYFSYDFVQILEDYGMKYVMRVRDDSLFVPVGEDNDSTVIFESDTHKVLVRVLKYQIPSSDSQIKDAVMKEIATKEQDMKEEDVKEEGMNEEDMKEGDTNEGDIEEANTEEATANENNQYVLVTNLLSVEQYPKEKFVEWYHKRWDIETYFKDTKYNTKSAYIVTNKEANLQKMVFSNLIMTQITSIIEGIVDKYCKSTKNHILNKKMLFDGIYQHLLCGLIYGNIGGVAIEKFMDNYINYVKKRPNRHYARTCKTPIFKWSSKRYLSEKHKKEKATRKKKGKIIKRQTIDDNKINRYVIKQDKKGRKSCRFSGSVDKVTNEEVG